MLCRLLLVVFVALALFGPGWTSADPGPGLDLVAASEEDDCGDCDGCDDDGCDDDCCGASRTGGGPGVVVWLAPLDLTEGVTASGPRTPWILGADQRARDRSLDPPTRPPIA